MVDIHPAISQPTGSQQPATSQAWSGPAPRLKGKALKHIATSIGNTPPKKNKKQRSQGNLGLGAGPWDSPQIFVFFVFFVFPMEIAIFSEAWSLEAWP